MKLKINKLSGIAEINLADITPGLNHFINSKSYTEAMNYFYGLGIDPAIYGNDNTLWHAAYFLKSPGQFLRSAWNFYVNQDAAGKISYSQAIKAILKSMGFTDAVIKAAIESLDYTTMVSIVNGMWPEWGGEWLHSAMIKKDLNRFLKESIAFYDTLKDPVQAAQYAKDIKSFLEKYAPARWEQKIDENLTAELMQTIFAAETAAAQEQAKIERAAMQEQKKQQNMKVIGLAAAGLIGTVLFMNVVKKKK